MPKRIADEHHRNCLDRWGWQCANRMRVVAREHGYALAVHGSMAFDIDVLLVPWVAHVSAVHTLIAALQDACREVTSLPVTPCVFTAPNEWQHPAVSDGNGLLWQDRPHGRRAFVWQLGGGVYVDCSVMLPSGLVADVTNVK